MTDGLYLVIKEGLKPWVGSWSHQRFTAEVDAQETEPVITDAHPRTPEVGVASWGCLPYPGTWSCLLGQWGIGKPGL